MHAISTNGVAKFKPTPWWLYLLACEHGRTYAGIAIDVYARFQLHVIGKGAKFTNANRPIKILGVQQFATTSEALKAEHALKQLVRPEKLKWALGHSVIDAN